MCVTRKENLERTADKIIAINNALTSKVVAAFKTLAGSLEIDRENLEQLEEYLLNNAANDAEALLELSKDLSSVARKLNVAATLAKKYKELEEESERKEREEQEKKELEDAQKRLDLDLDECSFFIKNATEEYRFIINVMAGVQKNEADTLEVRRARVEHWFFNADWWLKEAEKELEARPALKSVKDGFYSDAIKEKRDYLNNKAPVVSID